MNCQQIQQRIDNYLDGGLDLQDEAELHAHLDYCNDCRMRLQQANEIMAGLKKVTVPPMSPGFAQHAVRQAASQVKQRPHRNAFIAGFSSSAVAGIALLFVVAGLLPNDNSVGTNALSEVMISVDSMHTVNLAFDVANPIQNATLKITLPENVEVVGYPGMSQLSWQTSLTQGRNILPLPLKGTANADGELIATVEHDGKTKSIRIKVRVGKQLAPQAEVVNRKWV